MFKVRKLSPEHLPGANQKYQDKAWAMNIEGRVPQRTGLSHLREGIVRYKKIRTPTVRGPHSGSFCLAQAPGGCRVVGDINDGDVGWFPRTASELSLLWSPSSSHVQAASAHPQWEGGGV